MSEKHTPGPWVTIPAKREWHSGEASIFEDGCWYVLPEEDVERLPIAIIDHSNDHYGPAREQAEFDARLIASAPEMLEMLKEASQCFSDIASGKGGWAWEGVLSDMDALIAKAEGKS